MENIKSKDEAITYIGGCDVIRTSSYKWKEFDNSELIIGKQYVVKGVSAYQEVYIKKDDKFIKDTSGERYYYYKINNENNEEINVWSGFFNN